MVKVEICSIFWWIDLFPADFFLFIMGHGASSPKAALNPLFVNHELVQGSKYLADDETFRTAFVNYIKSGLWIEKLAKLVREDKANTDIAPMLAHSPMSASVNNFSFKEYQSSKTIDELEMSTKEWSSSKRTTASSQSPKNSLKSTTYKTDENFNESYVSIEDFRCFNSPQLIAILANVLYPLFITHSELDSSSQSGVESMSSELMDAVGLRKPKRVQEVFLGMAAYFDESALHAELQTGAWVACLPETFDAYMQCITISDTSQEGCPIVYANKAFLNLTGFTSTQVCGNNFSILNGPKTEESQIKLLDETVKFQRAAKINITHYTSGSRREFPNFIALKPSGKYVISVHFVPSRSNRVEDLKVSVSLLSCADICSIVHTLQMKPNFIS